MHSGPILIIIFLSKDLTIITIISCLQTCTVATWWPTTLTTRARVTGDFSSLSSIRRSQRLHVFSIFATEFCKSTCFVLFAKVFYRSNYLLSSHILSEITYSLGLPANFSFSEVSWKIHRLPLLNSRAQFNPQAFEVVILNTGPISFYHDAWKVQIFGIMRIYFFRQKFGQDFKIHVEVPPQVMKLES